jgi:hypothetical protein
MKKQSLQKLLIGSLCFILFTLQTPDLVAQPTERPWMWVSSEERAKDWKNFKKRKLAKMSENARTPDAHLNTSFYLGNFWKWIDYLQRNPRLHGPYLHVYPGIDDTKNVVLIFAPAKSKIENDDHSYHVFSKEFDTANPDELNIDTVKAKRWRDSFANAMYLTPKEKLRADNKYKKPGASETIASDTRYITYCWEDIVDLLKIKSHFMEQGDITENARGFLGAYPKRKGARRGELKGHFKNRILVYYDFLNSRGENIDLTKIAEFDRLKPRAQNKCGEKPLNNGQLCPTTCD